MLGPLPGLLGDDRGERVQHRVKPVQPVQPVQQPFVPSSDVPGQQPEQQPVQYGEQSSTDR